MARLATLRRAIMRPETSAIDRALMAREIEQLEEDVEGRSPLPPDNPSLRSVTLDSGRSSSPSEGIA